MIFYWINACYVHQDYFKNYIIFQMLNLYLFFFVLIAEPNGSVRRRLAWNCWPRLETMRPSSGFTAVPRPIWAPGHTRPPLPPNRPTGPRPPRSISITATQPLHAEFQSRNWCQFAWESGSVSGWEWWWGLSLWLGKEQGYLARGCVCVPLEGSANWIRLATTP